MIKVRNSITFQYFIKLIAGKLTRNGFKKNKNMLKL